MGNDMTNRFGVVQKSTVDAFPLVGRTIYAHDGVSYEVFRKDLYLGSVRLPDNESRTNEVQQMKVQRGDMLYCVPLTPITIELSGTFTTKDRYSRLYDMQAQLLVSDSVRFIFAYRRELDPLGRARQQIKERYEFCMTDREHDEAGRAVSFDRLNKLLHIDFGLELITYKSTLRSDQKYIQLHEIALNEKVTESQLRATMKEQELRTELTQQQKVMENAFKRDEEEKEHIHKLKKSFRETAAKELKIILAERIREVYDRQGSVRAASQEYIDLQGVFDHVLQGHLAGPSLQDEDEESTILSFDKDDVVTAEDEAIQPSMLFNEP